MTGAYGEDCQISFFCIMREALVYFSLTVQHHKIILQCELFFNSKFYENYYLRSVITTTLE
jgi:hypothetical protein